MRMLHRSTLRLGGMLVASVVLAVSAGGVATASAHKKPAKAGSGSAINIGGIFTNTPIPFGVDAEAMIKAVFAQTNSQGGIHGRKLVFHGGDDNNSTSTAAQLVREYAGDNAVAYVGSASTVDCGINGPYYKQHNLVSITAVGVTPQCYSSPNIASVEPSPYQQITAALYYAYKYLHVKKQCVVLGISPGVEQGVKQAIKIYEKATGNKLASFSTVQITSMTSASGVDPVLIQAKDAGCQSFFYTSGNDTSINVILGQAKSEGMSKVAFIGNSVSYTQPLATTSAKYGVPFYAMTALYPFTSISSKNAAYRGTAKKYHVNMTEFSADAYVSAEWLVSGLKAIKGPINAKSVKAYFRAGHPYPTTLSPAPLVFGPGKSHPNLISKVSVVKLTKQGWSLAKFGMSVPR